MKKHHFITVLGKNDIALSLDKLHAYGPIISVCNKDLENKYVDYVWTREEKDLLWFLQQRPSPVDCVTTPELYKKYVFYDQVHSFPPISPQFNLTLDNNTDDQTLAVLSALGLAEKRILLVLFQNGTMYSYWKVHVRTFQRMRNCHSIGKFYNKNIKNTYSHTKQSIKII